MRRLTGIALLVALVAIPPVLAGCSNFDPESLDVFGLSSKDKLKGKRELLFPNGVPGVTQGIPPEYKEGYHTPAIADLPPGDQDATPPAAKATTAKSMPVEPVRQSNLGKPMTVHKSTRKRTVKRRSSSKTRHHVVKRTTKPKPKAKATATAAKPKGTTAPWPSTTQQTATQQNKGTQAPWPSTTASQESQAGWPSGKQQQDQKLAPWPSAPPSGTFSK